jgi:ADP-heptose:LPS heptosyltransferase
MMNIFHKLIGIKQYIVLFLDTAILKFAKRLDKKGRVLIIRLDAIGDFVLWLNSAKSLRRIYPKKYYQITLIANKAWVELARELSYWDEIWQLDRMKFLWNIHYRWKVMTKVRKAGFEIAIQPTFSREFDVGDTLIRASAAEQRIGSIGDLSNISANKKSYSDNWYTKLIPTSNKPLMELERNAEFIQELGLKEIRACIPSLPVSGNLPSGFDLSDYYVIFPGANFELKKWPLSHFKELVRRIFKATGWVGVICGGQGEKLLGETLEKSVDVPLQNWIGRTSLRELVEIIAKAHVLIGNDTSAVHIAAAVSTPAVCILGGGHFGRFIPYHLEVETEGPLPEAVFQKMECFGCNWRCIYPTHRSKPAPCVAKVSVDMVWEKVENVLERIREKKNSSGTKIK